MFTDHDRARLHEVVSYLTLREATYRLAAHLDRPVSVQHLPGHLEPTVDGQTDGLIVWYPPQAPLATVAHEVAHMVGGDDHGPAWHTSFTLLAHCLLRLLPVADYS